MPLSLERVVSDDWLHAEEIIKPQIIETTVDSGIVSPEDTNWVD